MGEGEGIYRLISALEKLFPALRTSNYQITSPRTPNYNCIAWAASDTTLWWWPDNQNVGYWPVEVPREETVTAFVEAYGLLGYSPCNSSDYEEGFEKIAVFTNDQGKPTHAARQLASGHWTSKLGKSEDIDHEKVEDLCGSTYGTVAAILKRSIASPHE